MIRGILLTLASLGSQGNNEPILGGVIVFLTVGVAMLYMSFYNDEFADSVVFKAVGALMFVLAAISFLWPYRPWPTAV